MFKKRENVAAIEEGKLLSPKFDKDGLIPVVTTDYKTGEVLMHGYMNAEALKKTIESKEAYYWSRSRKSVWHKGEVSGFIQKVIEIRIDDDQDSIWMSVDIGNGASCHVGYKSCFYRSIPLGKVENFEKVEMEFKEKKKRFDPNIIYKNKTNPTKIWIIMLQNEDRDLNEICEECKKEDESITQNLIVHGYKICDSCKLSKTIFPI